MRKEFINVFVAVVVLDGGPPAEVIETEVAHGHFLAVVKAQDLCNVVFHTDRHIADVNDSRIRLKASARLRHDGRRVGVVQHPAVRRVFLHVLDVFQNARNGAHAVSDSAWAAGFLADYAVF